MKRPTMRDVAKKAGVGIATVDRVLSGRRAVRKETATRVFEAASALGYHSTPVIKYRLEGEKPRMTFGFVLPKQHQPFYQRLIQALRDQVEVCPSVRGRALFHFATSQSPAEHAGLIETATQRTDVVAASVVSHQSISDAIAAAESKGIPVFSLLNDFSPDECRGYIGLDNYRAGRVAGWLLSNTIREPGSIGVVVGGNLWQGHQLRESGLRSYVREHQPALRIHDSVLNVETRKVTYDVVHDLLATVDDLQGLYITGGGVEGAVDALRETTRPGQIKTVAHVLNNETQSALISNHVTAVIGTPTNTLANSLVSQMSAAYLGLDPPKGRQTILKPEIHLPEYL